jgi:hypothetical protein
MISINRQTKNRGVETVRVISKEDDPYSRRRGEVGAEVSVGRRRRGPGSGSSGGVWRILLGLHGGLFWVSAVSGDEPG